MLKKLNTRDTLLPGVFEEIFLIANEPNAPISKTDNNSRNPNVIWQNTTKLMIFLSLFGKKHRIFLSIST
jgi:hypothetical protein